MAHYNEHYFAWQKQIGIVGGTLNAFKFEAHVSATDTLLDFGCGGGYLLGHLKARKKIGFEINNECYADCKVNGIDVVSTFEDIADGSVDTIISNHALEHVPLPLDTLLQLRNKLCIGGTMIIVVPCEQPHEIEFQYKDACFNQHLYTWCPQSLGNLAKLAGLHVQSCTAFQHRWVPDYKTTYTDPDIHDRCREYARETKNYQIKLVATRTQ